MAWNPQSPPQHLIPKPGGTSFNLGLVATAVGGLLVWLGSLLPIFRVGHTNYTMWASEPGLLGLMTFIPLAAGAAMASATQPLFVPQLNERRLGGLTFPQIRQIATAVTGLLVVGEWLSLVASSRARVGIGLFVIFLGVIALTTGMIIDRIPTRGTDRATHAGFPDAWTPSSDVVNPKISPATSEWIPPPPPQSSTDPGTMTFPGPPPAPPAD